MSLISAAAGAGPLPDMTLQRGASSAMFQVAWFLEMKSLPSDPVPCCAEGVPASSGLTTTTTSAAGPEAMPPTLFGRALTPAAAPDLCPTCANAQYLCNTSGGTFTVGGAASTRNRQPRGHCLHVCQA